MTKLDRVGSLHGMISANLQNGEHVRLHAQHDYFVVNVVSDELGVSLFVDKVPSSYCDQRSSEHQTAVETLAVKLMENVREQCVRARVPRI